MATNEELETRIAELEGMVVSEYDPPSGPEYSYPSPGEPMSDDMWSHLAKAWGSGVISYGGAPYRLGNVDDINNTLTVYKADDEGRESGAVLEGYAHRMTEDVTLKVPAVSEETDYVIGLKYDPLDEGRPIRLGVFTRPLKTTQGKKYIPIWEGRRNPSTVLSTVEWQTARSRISPTTTVAREKYLPDPRHSGLMWGTICYTYRDRVWFQLQWANEDGGEMVWKNISQPDWTTFNLTSPRIPSTSSPVQFRHLNGQVSFRGWVRRNSIESSFSNDNLGGSGWEMGVLPEYARPTRSVVIAIPGDRKNTSSTHRCEVSTDGVVRVHVATTTTYLCLDGVRFWTD